MIRKILGKISRRDGRRGSAKAVADRDVAPPERESPEMFQEMVERALGDELRRDMDLRDELWVAIANIDWIHIETGIIDGLTFRGAALVIAEICADGIPDMEYYMAGTPGHVSERIASAFAREGWTWKYTPA